jgi:hypothetical protein
VCEPRTRVGRNGRLRPGSKTLVCYGFREGAARTGPQRSALPSIHMSRPRRARSGELLRTSVAGFPLFVGERRTPRIITADVWACTRHHIEERKRLSADAKRRALAHLEQASDFFLAANTPHTSSRPLLYFYAFLNLAKVLLVAEGRQVPARMKHGIWDPSENIRARLRFEGQRVRTEDADGKALFPALVQELREDTEPVAPRTYKVLQLLGQVVGIHRAYMRVTQTKPAFVPIRRIDVLRDKTGVWGRFVLDTADRDVWETLPVARKLFGRALGHVAAEGDARDNETWFEAYEGGDGASIDTSLGWVGYFVRRLGVWGLLTRHGYRYYFGTFRRTERLPQLCSMYAAMFYLGSITRYKPYDFDRIITGRHAWLVSEFLATQPEQFLYLLASTLAGVEVVRPLTT